MGYPNSTYKESLEGTTPGNLLLESKAVLVHDRSRSLRDWYTRLVCCLRKVHSSIQHLKKFCLSDSDIFFTEGTNQLPMRPIERLTAAAQT